MEVNDQLHIPSTHVGGGGGGGEPTVSCGFVGPRAPVCGVGGVWGVETPLFKPFTIVGGKR